MADRTEDPLAYLPLDRRQALAEGRELPGRTSGSAIFADITGFTALTARLTRSLGLRRGAEELPHHLDQAYTALIEQVHGFGGSVISFAGDAITCWLDGDDGSRASACALAMQRAMAGFTQVQLPDGSTAEITVKVAAVNGPVRRMVAGDPDVQLIDVIGGGTLTRLAAAEGVARSGEVIVDEATYRNLQDALTVSEWREAGPDRFAVVTAAPSTAVLTSAPVSRRPPEDTLKRWLLPAVYGRLSAGQGELLTELRPAVALFAGFGGLDYDSAQDAPARLDSFIRRVQAEAVRLDGSLLQLTVGDKGSYLYVVFGAPVSNEDDARRAVTMALALQQLRLEFGWLDDLRIGINQGTMRTGAYGSPSRRTYGVLGDGTNMAARLMGQASDGQVLVSLEVRRAAGGAFEWRELEPVRVKGRDEPLPVFEPVALADWRGQAAPSQAGKLIGRKRELDLLTDRAAAARSGLGQLLRITGEAGLGKSSLIAHLLAAAGQHGTPSLVGEGEAFLADTPYRPWRRVFAAILGLEGADLTPEALTRALQATAPDLLPRLPLLAPVLELSVPDNELTASLDPELRKSSREALLLELLRRTARKAGLDGQALLLVLENVQWFDELSAELLSGAARIAPGLPMLLITTARPTGQAAFQVPAHDLELAPLSPQESLELLRLRLAGRELPEHVEQLVLAQSEGNPYYLEELADYLAGQPPEHADAELPPTLHSLILSRIDRLSEHQKAVIKAASIIGRTFQLDWLDGYYPALGGAERVAAEVQELRHLDLLRPQQPEAGAYGFRQAMTREVTYGSIPFRSRSSLHTRLAMFIENQLVTPEQPRLGLLALHYGLGTDLARKHEYLKKAGVAAQEAYANESALRWYGQLLPLVSGAEKVELLQRQGQVQLHMGRYGDSEASCLQALELARDQRDARGEAVSMRLLGELLEKQGEYADSIAWLERAEQAFTDLAEERELVQVLLALGGNVLWQQGAYDAARERLELALELARKHDDARGVARSQHGLGNIEMYQGRLEPARELFEASLVTRRQIGDSLGIANALNNLGIIAASLDGAERARGLFEESLAIRRETGDRAGTAVALNNVGFMAAEMGELQAAFELNFESLELRREIGDPLGAAVTLNSLGYLQLRLGNAAEAAGHYLESLQLSSDVGNVRETAAALAGAAALLAAHEPTVAVRLAGAAEAQLESIGSSVEPEVRELLDRAQAIAAATGAAGAGSEGRKLSLAEAVSAARSGLHVLTGPSFAA